METPQWTSFREAIRVVAYPPFLKKTIRTALIIGLVLFFINHFDEVLRGHANAATWIKGATTCLVRFASRTGGSSSQRAARETRISELLIFPL